MDKDNQITKEILTDVVVEQADTPNEHFTINSDKAAKILGVNRTRLSQLTSKGLFPYERRKVDSRSRLFYRLTDLLSYQRKSSFGNINPVSAHTPDTKALVPLLPPGQSTLATQQPISISKSKNFSKLGPSKLQTPQRALKTAVEVKEIYQKKAQLQNLVQKVNLLEKKLNQTIELLVKTQTVLAKKEDQALRIKKSMLQRPRMKRALKVIKR